MRKLGLMTASVTQPVLPQFCSIEREEGRDYKHTQFLQLLNAMEREGGAPDVMLGGSLLLYQ